MTPRRHRGTGRAARIALLALTCLAGGPLRAAPAATQPAAPAPPPRWYDPKDPPPTPPMQGKAWTPPDGAIPGTMVEAAGAVFRAGLADPRGCQFRYLFVRMHNHTELISGWLLPGTDREGRRYGIGWDGLVVPVIPHLEADLAAEVDRRVRQSRCEEVEGHGNDQKADEVVTGLLPHAMNTDAVQVCLLARLGEGKLARRVYEAWNAECRLRTKDPEGPGPAPDAPDTKGWPADTLTRHLLLSWNHRLKVQARRAFLRNDDWTVLARGREMDHLAGALPEELRPLPEVAGCQQAVAQVRAATKEGPVERVVEAGLEKYPDREVRIAALIRDLETVGQGQPIPASVDGSDPVVAALVQEGKYAVEPLLRCMETDTRLSRHAESLPESMSILNVPWVAFQALGGILPAVAAVEGPRYDELRPALTAAWIRRYLKDHPEALPPGRPPGPPRPQTRPAADKPIDILADEKAQPAAWATAAYELCGLSELPGWSWRKDWPTAPPADCAEFKTRRGEVAALIRRRVGQVLAMPVPPAPTSRPAGGPTSLPSLAEAGGVENKPVDSPAEFACWLAQALTVWEPGPASRQLVTQVEREFMARQARHGHIDLAACIASVVAQRTAAGDEGALGEYVAWLGTLPPNLPAQRPWLLNPLVAHPTAPPVVEIADWFFASPASPLMHKSADGKWRVAPALAWQPQLLVLGGYRRMVLEALADTSPIPPDLRATLRPGDKEAPTVGEAYAFRLTTIRGMPDTSGAVDKPSRRKLIEACIDRLKRYGPHLRVPWANMGGPFDADSPLSIALPKPARPATPADVRDGRAVFALPGPGAKRLVDAGELPCDAILMRTPVPDIPDHYRFSILRTEGFPVTGREEGGEGDNLVPMEVLQAEEVWRGGRWRRFYGLCLLNSLERVAAENVLFPSDEGDVLAGGFEAMFAPAGPVRRPVPAFQRKEENVLTVDNLPPGQPARVVLKVYNRLGVDQAIPAELVRVGKDGQVALVRGIRVRAWYLPPAPAAMLKECSAEAWEDEAHWLEQPPAPIGAFPSSATQTLRPRQSVEVFTLDLRRLTDMTRPGIYRFRVLFDTAAGGFALGYTQAITVRVTGK